MSSRRAFVTVGTTKFDKLIEEASSDKVLDILDSLGFSTVQYQVGNGSIEEKKHPKIKLKYDKYFENFKDMISSSDLIISHAGAGTCLEVLQQKKPLIVVINDELMDNHQIELAEQLANDGHLQYCIPSKLSETLLENKITILKPYPKANPKIFSNYLDECMGFK